MRSRSSSSVAFARDGDHVGPRRHHVAHALVAEFDDLLDQARFVLLDDSFFGGRVDEGFDGLLLFRRGRARLPLRKAGARKP